MCLTSTMADGASNNALVIKTIDGKRSLTDGPVAVPEPSSNQARIHVSHVAQNSMDGTVPDRAALGQS